MSSYNPRTIPRKPQPPLGMAPSGAQQQQSGGRPSAVAQQLDGQIGALESQVSRFGSTPTTANAMSDVSPTFDRPPAGAKNLPLTTKKLPSPSKLPAPTKGGAPAGAEEAQPLIIRRGNSGSDKKVAAEELPPLMRLHPSLGTSAISRAPKGLFGSIRFPDSAGDPTKFVRLRADALDPTSPADVLSLMSETWSLELPSALISVLDSTSTKSEQNAVEKSVKLSVQRGIAEAMTRTHAWLTTSATVDCLGTRVAGQAVKYARRVLNASAPTCVGVCDFDGVLYSEELRETANGKVFRYVAATPPAGQPRKPSGRRKGGSKPLDAFHSHLLMVDAQGGSAFRARLEKRMSSFDISGDGIRTPMCVLVIGGDARAFEKVAGALDASDPATGSAVPVLVVRETGGAAYDIYNYILGEGVTWPGCNQKDETASARPLPTTDAVPPEGSGCAGGHTAEYVAQAKKWLPRILALGNDTGNNTTRQLAFYSFESEDNEYSLATTIQKAMLNDCPDARQEALLAVKWNEPSILQEKLEEMYGGAADAGAAGEDEEEEDTLTADGTPRVVNPLAHLDASTVHRAQHLVTRAQARVRGLFARRAARRKNEEKTSILCLALERAQPSVVESVLGYQGSKPDNFRLDELFRASHNRYPINGFYDKDIKIKEMWLSASAEDDESDDEEGEGGDKSKPALDNAFYASLDEYELEGSKLGIKKLLNRGGTFHAEMVLSAMADDYATNVQARWALQTHDPRFVTSVDDFRDFINLRLECMSMKSDWAHGLKGTWDDLMTWCVLAGNHEIANLIWRKTKTPMRAALTASSMCMRLASYSELSADHDELNEKAEEYEKLVIDLLDSIREKETAFHLNTLLPWDYVDETRPGDRAEPVLQPNDAGEWVSAVGLTTDDVGAEVSLDGGNVVVTRRGKHGDKVEEHSFTARFKSPPPSDFAGGTILSVEPVAGGAVMIASDLLDTVLSNPEVMIRRVFLWPSSCLDLALAEDHYGIVGHRHCQDACDRFFVGRYPGSKVCIEPHVGLKQILLQAALPFLSIVKVEKPEDELQENHNAQTDVGGDPTRKGSLRNEFIKDLGLQDDTDPQLKAALRAVQRAANKNGVSDAKEGKGGGGGGDKGGGDKGGGDKAGKGGSDFLFLDSAFCESITDKLEFYRIPKVKFAMWFASHVLYTLLLTQLGIYFSDDKQVWKHGPGAPELLFYFWSFARLVSEAAEFGSFSTFGGFCDNLNDYLGDQWNKLDALFNLLIVWILGMRIHVALDTLEDEPLPLGGVSEDHGVAIVGSNLFAVMIVLCWFRMLQFLGYYQSTGVLQIILGDMMNDIIRWTVLSAIISLGFAFAFVVLLPPSASLGSSPALFMGLHPVYESIWLWVGSGVQSDRATMEDATGDEVPTNVVMPTLMWIYQFIIGVLLVNLLIAMMSDTYAAVMEKGRERWMFERAQLISEFKDTKAPMPPPFNVLWKAAVDLPALWWGAKTDEMDISGFKTVPNLKLLKKLEIAEGASLRKCIEMQTEREQGEMLWQIGAISEKLGEVQEASRTQYETLMRSLSDSKKKGKR